MVIEINKHNASIVSFGENIIACADISEAFIDVFSINYDSELSLIKKAERYVNGKPIIRADVMIGEKLYKDVEFMLVRDKPAAIIINENSLSSGEIIVESKSETEDAALIEEDYTVADDHAASIDSIVEQYFIEAEEVDVPQLKKQVVEEQRNKIQQHIQGIQDDLINRVSIELTDARGKLAEDTLHLQEQLRDTNSEYAQQAIEQFRSQLQEWIEKAEKYIASNTTQSIQLIESGLQSSIKAEVDCLGSNIQNNITEGITQATIDKMAATKAELISEIDKRFRIGDEIEELRETQIHQIIEKHLNEAKEAITVSQLQLFNEQVANFLLKQQNWLTENILTTTRATSASIDEATLSINRQIDAAVKSINEKAQDIHNQRMQTIEQCIAEALSDNTPQKDGLLSEARTSARKAVKDALDSHKATISRDLDAQLKNIQKGLQDKLAAYAQSYAGGGTVAKQFADGGDMDGSLNVTRGQILSGGIDLFNIFSTTGASGYQTLTFDESTAALTIAPNGNTISLSALSGGSSGSTIIGGAFLPLSGGTITGNLAVTGNVTLSSNLHVSNGTITSKSITLSGGSGIVIYDNIQSFSSNIYPSGLTQNRILYVPDGSGYITLTNQPSGFRQVTRYGLLSPASGVFDVGDLYICTGDNTLYVYSSGSTWDVAASFASTADVAAISADVLAIELSATNWNNTYNTVRALSSTWGTSSGGLTGQFLPLSGGTLTGNLSVQANITAVNSIQLTTTAGITAIQPGLLSWNADEDTANLGISNNVNLQIGQEQLVRVKNTSADIIRNGAPVYISGAVGVGSGNIAVSAYDSRENGIDDLYLLGIATEELAINSFGFATTFGKVRDVIVSEVQAADDTGPLSAWDIGTTLYVSTTERGKLTSVRPEPPNEQLPIVLILSTNGTHRTFFVRAAHGYNLNEIHDVLINSPSANQILSYNAVSGVWTNTVETDPIFTTWAQANSGNYTSTSTTVRAQSANNVSVYSTVNTNSATWSAGSGSTSYNFYSSIGTPQTFVPTASGVAADSESFTLASSFQVAIVTLNGQVLRDIEYNQVSNVITITPAVGLEIDDEILVFQNNYPISNGVTLNINTKTTSHTISLSDYTVLVDATISPSFVYINAAQLTSGRILNIKKIDSTLNTVTLSTNASIDGSSTAVINTQYESITIQSDGYNWWIL